MSEIEFVGEPEVPPVRPGRHRARGHRRQRVAVMLSATALVLGSIVSLATAAPANASTTCRTLSKHYSIGSGSVPIHVAYTDMHVTLCTNGNEITSEKDSSSSNETGPGETAGFDITLNSPYQTSFNSGGFSGGSFGVSAKGKLRECLPKIRTFCSYDYSYSEHLHVDMLNELYVRASGSNEFVLHGRVFKYAWTHASTTTAKGVTFS